METATVCTVGGRKETKTLPVYECRIRDLKGETKVFHAMGLERITGEMFCPLSGIQLSKMFPDTYGAEHLGVRAAVDYMIGLDRSEWQPQRIIIAENGGDF